MEMREAARQAIVTVGLYQPACEVTEPRSVFFDDAPLPFAFSVRCSHPKVLAYLSSLAPAEKTKLSDE